LKSWINTLMTPDDIWDIAAIDKGKRGGEQANLAMAIGHKAAKRLHEAQAPAAATSESEPTVPEVSRDANNNADIVMQDSVPVS
jgi:hypothetical protein